MTKLIKTKRTCIENTPRTLNSPHLRCSKCSQSKRIKEFTIICRSCRKHKEINKKTYYVKTRESIHIIVAYSTQEVKDLLPFKVYNKEIHLVSSLTKVELKHGS